MKRKNGENIQTFSVAAGSECWVREYWIWCCLLNGILTAGSRTKKRNFYIKFKDGDFSNSRFMMWYGIKSLSFNYFIRRKIYLCSILIRKSVFHFFTTCFPNMIWPESYFGSCLPDAHRTGYQFRVFLWPIKIDLGVLATHVPELIMELMHTGFNKLFDTESEV